jgi:hypothetical protein
MSETYHTTETSDNRELNIGKLGPAMGLLGIVLLLVTLGMMFLGGHDLSHQMYGSYMFGFMFWLSVTIGMFGLTLLHHTVRGSWTLSILRILEAGSSWVMFVVLGALFLPVLFNLSVLYEWADPKIWPNDHVILHKRPYLNEGGFITRFVIYILLWSSLAWGMRNSALRQEKSKDFKLEAGRSSWGAVGIVAFMLSVTFAFTDLGMSLEPHWYSTMYGVWQIVAGAGAALAFAILILCTNARRAPFNSIVHPNLTKDLGNMQFAFTMLWGYTTVSQFLIIWMGNLPETTQYFAKRSSLMHPPGMEANHWGALGLLLIIGRFIVPFFILLTPRTKKTPENLKKIVGWIFTMHFFEIYLLIIPAIHGRAPMGPINSYLWSDILAFVTIGAIWLAVFGLQTRKAPLIVGYDNRLQEAKAHAH